MDILSVWKLKDHPVSYNSTDIEVWYQIEIGHIVARLAYDICNFYEACLLQ